MAGTAAHTPPSSPPRTPPALADTAPDLPAALARAVTTPDPYATYRRLRADHPVADFAGAVSLSRYVDVAAALRHPHLGTDDRASDLHRDLRAQDRLGADYLSQADDQSFLHRDPPDHTRLRTLTAKALTPRRMAALRPYVQRQVDQLLDAAVADGHLEAVGELAYPLSIAVACELLGIPAQDRPFVAGWPRTQLCCSFEAGSLAVAARDPEPTPGASRQAEADRLQRQLGDYFVTLIGWRRTHPGDDLVSALLAATDHGDRLTDAEANATLRLLFVAGYENSVNLIGNGLLALLRHPEQWTALREHPELAGGAVDEVLRYDAPFQLTRRVALTQLDIAGYRIARGRHVILWLAAANRDPDRFADPDRFDIRRDDRRHLAFGSGIHACLGGPLARLTAEIVFTTLARRLVAPALGADAPRYRDDLVRSLSALPITMTAIRPA